MKYILSLTALLLAPLAALHAADALQLPRSKLQIINGSNQTVDILWLKSDTERVSNGSVAQGKIPLLPQRSGIASRSWDATTRPPPP